MAWDMYYKRWGSHRGSSWVEPKPGDRCLLGEAHHGWRVRLVGSGDEVEVLSGFEKNTRVHRRGDVAVQLLPNDVEVEIVDPKKERDFQPGQVVMALGPSKHAGFVGVIGKSTTMLQVYELNGSGKKVLIDQDLAVLVPGRWVVDNT